MSETKVSPVKLPEKKSVIDKRYSSQKIGMIGQAGIGKCHAKGTKILSYSGNLVKVEDIKPKDKIMGLDSTCRTVLACHNGREKLFKVTPTKGPSFIVTGNHLMSLTKSFNLSKNTDKILIKNIYEMSEQGDKNLKLYRPKIVNFPFPSKKLSLDPYYLGLWLGDGTSSCQDITTQSQEILEYLEGYAKSLNMHLKTYPNTRSKAIGCRITEGYFRKKDSFCIRKELKKLNLINNKHIPYNYLTHCENVRLNLLAGIIDTDGYIAGKVNYEVTIVNEKLAKDIVFLARSLGFLSFYKEKKATIKSIGYECIAYRISIIGNCTKIPIKLKYKKVPKTKINKNPLVTGFTIEEIGIGEYYGFGIDGNKLYLDENFIVHHNSSFFAQDPNAYFLQTEAGLNFLEVYKNIIRDWEDIRQVYKLLIQANEADKFPYSIIVIDTIDRLVKCAEEAVIMEFRAGVNPEDRSSVNTIGDVGTYGKGYQLVRDKIMKLLIGLENLPCAIAYIGHPETREIKPDMGKPYDKTSISVGGKLGPDLLAWTDHLLHVSTRMGGSEMYRTVYTIPTQTREAKSKGGVVSDGWKWEKDDKTNYEYFKNLFD